MIRHIYLAWKNITHSRRQTIAVSLLSHCAMTLMIVGSFLGYGLRGGLIATVEPFDMLAGYGGSYQMVLNTVFLQDYPAGNLSYRIVEELNRDPRVERAIPLAFGDNYRGYRIVGTDATIFSHFAKRGDEEPWLRFNRGELFKAGSHDAVIGCRVAADLGLGIGDSFVSSHGFTHGGETHDHAPYIVSGILASCMGPYDQAIFVDLGTIWESHGIHAGEHEHGQEHEGSQDDEHFEHEDSRQVTAIMVKPAGYAEAYQIFTDFNNRHDVDMVFPAQVIVRLLSILGQADWLFQALGYATGVIAAVTIALSLYWSAVSRTAETRILRLIGAEKRDVVAMLIWEGALSIIPGLLAGCAVGHLILFFISNALERKVSLHVAVGFSWMDVLFCLALLLAGTLGELFAALQATRKTD